jgi:hypothetical protein
VIDSFKLFLELITKKYGEQNTKALITKQYPQSLLANNLRIEQLRETTTATTFTILLLLLG